MLTLILAGATLSRITAWLAFHNDSRRLTMAGMGHRLVGGQARRGAVMQGCQWFRWRAHPGGMQKRQRPSPWAACDQAGFFAPGCTLWMVDREALLVLGV